ncbi:ABC transporter permease [Corynebacterium fournieri]|uniref:ABC transporter permease n=1 Tax=Corynebacterium fournieri TaxID=1852390 RepID=UPI000A2F0828|nr:ABC transporter permease [Corynebacterium fournieri]WJY98560.1 FtsX-like permease family protein [Corynebacterium fournieri]
MFVGIREITSAKGRFGLIAGTVALITLLVVVLTGLTAGLGKQNTSALEALDPQSVVFQDPEDPSFTTSRVEARDGLTPLGTSQMLLTKADGTDAAVSILALPEGTELPGGEALGNQAVAAPGLEVGEGESVTVAGNPITVGAIGEDLAFSHSPVLWVPTEFWKESMHTNADGTVLLADHEVDGGVSLTKAFDGLPAYSSEQGSLKLIQGFLYAIAALVIVAFLTVWTMQRTRDLAILKAIGASNGYLLKDALGQSAVLLGAGAVIGGAAAFGLGMWMQGSAPFSLNTATAVAPPVAIWALGMAGALIATRSIVKVNPQQALGGAA